jgi:hypothetical protein
MSDLLKEALADAKAVRATALANAKVALEEAFGERVQALFAERLKEESADDVMSSDNDGSSNETMMQPSDDGMSNEETLSDGELEEIIAELERDAENVSEEGEPAPADPNAMTAPMDPTAVPAPAPAPVSDTPMTTAPVSDTPMATAPAAPAAPAAPVAPVDPSLAPAAPAAEDIEEISLDELLAELECDEESDHDQKDGSHVESDYAEQIAEVTAQRDQAMKTVEILRSQINEVNLLNAKLLYTNKLFKQFSMNNEQKMKVVENFDLTTSVREVKLTYAIMAESFNLGGSVVRRKNTTATTITEGLASKAVASTKPSQPIVANGNLMAERFKTLAGIKK